jgi:divalent metal cation (Fe/Co/Zn/Cd) transporter
MAYNFLEAIVALYAGIRADSIALVGFGLDSVIELAAATVLLWRLRVESRGNDAERIARAETRVRRFVGVTFFALALYVATQSGWTLWMKDAPSESVLGIVLAVLSLILMPLIAWGKLRAARKIGSGALAAEAKETLACSYLSFCLLLGLGANAVAGWWWADPVAAILMVPWLVREGMEGFEEEGEED